MATTLNAVLEAAQAAADRGASPAAVRDAAYEAAARFAPAASQATRAAPEVAYRSADGEMLDEIAHLRYGTAAAVEQVLEANPALAGARPRLPGGTLVELPSSAPPPAAAVVTLWS